MMDEAKMKAIVVRQPGASDQLEVGEVAKPQANSDELLVRVKATALNRADILQREGRYPAPKGASPILGLEMAGVVEFVGANCNGWHTGDRVCALLPGGGYAQYATIPAKMAIPIPDNLSFEDAAAIPEVFLTAYQALHWIGKVRPEEYVLIHAGASGVGTAAIQLVKAAGAIPIVTAGSARKLDFCLKLGAKVAINYKDGEFSTHVLEATNNKGVDLILDFIGAAYWEQNMTCLAMDGRMVLLATMGGAAVDELNLGQILRKRVQVQGTTLRSRTPEYKVELTRDFVKNVLPGFEDGRFKPIVDSNFDFDNAGEAHNHMEANKNIGKIILLVNPELDPEAAVMEGEG